MFVFLICHFAVDEDRPNVDASKLSTVRMKLEEKRRQIEQEKRKMEVALSRQQQKVGKAAFLQAINKVLASYRTLDKQEPSWPSPQIVIRFLRHQSFSVKVVLVPFFQ